MAPCSMLDGTCSTSIDNIRDHETTFERRTTRRLKVFCRCGNRLNPEYYPNYARLFGVNCSAIPVLRRDHRQKSHKLIEYTMQSVSKNVSKWQRAQMPTQARCLRECRPSLSVISAAFIAFCNHIRNKISRLAGSIHHTGKSCLLAKTRSKASLNSSSFNIRCNSSRASTTRSRSLLSTTKMIP